MPAPTTIRELLVKLGVDADDKALKRFDRNFEALKKSAGQLVLGVTAVSGAMGYLVYKTGEYGFEILQAADKLNIATDALQEYRYAGAMVGIEQRTLTMGLQRFLRRAAEASAGTGEAKDTLAELGIKLKDSSGKLREADDLLNQVADAMKNVKDEGQLLRIAFKLFDSEGVQMVTLLKHGSEELERLREEARATGIVMDREALETTAEFRNELLTLKAVMIGVRNTIGVALMPVLIDAMRRFRGWWKINRDIVKERLDVWLKRVDKSLRRLIATARTIDSVVQATGGWGKAMDRVFKLLVFLAGAKMAQVVYNLWKTIKALRALVVTFAAAKGISLLWIAAFLKGILGVGLVLGGLYLIFEDLYVYLKGGESAMGRFIEKNREADGALGALARTMESIGDTFEAIGWAEGVDEAIFHFERFRDNWVAGFKEVIYWVEEGLLWALEAIAWLIDAIMLGVGQFSQQWKRVGAAIKKFFREFREGMDAVPWLSKAFDFLAPAFFPQQMGAPDVGMASAGMGGPMGGMSYTGGSYHFYNTGINEQGAETLVRNAQQRELRDAMATLGGGEG